MGKLLVNQGLISKAQLATALEETRNRKIRLGQALVQMMMVTEDDICRILSRQLGIPLAGLSERTAYPKVLNLLPADFCYKKSIAPIGFKNRLLWVAMSDPTDYDTLKDISFIVGCQAKPAVEKESVIVDFLMRHHPPPYDTSAAREPSPMADMIQVMEHIDSDDISFTSLEKAAKGGVIRQLTNGIMANAIKQRASDIHVEPQENEVIVRFRVDGVMRDVMSFTKTAHPMAVSRIKIMAGLDITIRRTPQDGRARIRVAERPFDLRISSLPTYFGEKIVIRILEAQITPPLEKLGISQPGVDTFRSLLNRPQGLILITGPTGSGKTTTLYACLHHIYSSELNIVTIEDPVEYSLPGINQVQVNTATGMTFAKGLRSLLRQDPDVVMVGEIRDRETAAIAFQAAQTGHLVLTTLHTNDAVSAITRLDGMGIDPFWISTSLLCIVAQRLVRKIHPACSLTDTVPMEIRQRFPQTDPSVFKKGKGCAGCGDTGYSGRIGIFELLIPTGELTTLFSQKAPAMEIFEAARKSGMTTMTEDGFRKAAAGITTIDEIMRTAPPGISAEGASAAAIPETPDPPRRIVSESTPDQATKDRILLVDDDESILRIVKKILAAEYYDVQDALSVQEGLDLAFAAPPDLILVDHEMPGMNGIQFIEKLKGHSRMAGIPVIMLTATQAEETEVMALTRGADDWIRKPIHRDRLLARIKRFLKRQRP